MAFGQKFNRESAEKDSSGEVSTASIWGFNAGSTTVRFLDDLEEWTEYWEHYDQNVKRFFPCTGDRETCKGCTNGMSSAHRWLSNAYVVDSDNKTKSGYVNLFKIPKSLMPKFIRHMDRKSTLLTHDYEIIRTGQGMDTDYDLERGEETDFDFDVHNASKLDHEDTLMAVYEEYMGESKKVNAAQPVEKAPVVTKGANSTPTAVEKKAEEIGEPPFEQPQAPESSDEGDEEVLTEEQLFAMEFDELQSLAKRAGLELPNSLTEATELAEWIVKTIGEE